MRPDRISKFGEWGYRLEAQMPDGFTPKVALLLICAGMFILAGELVLIIWLPR